MMGKMVKNMIYFVVLLLVVLLSFGVSRQSILFPNEEASWRLIRDVSILIYIRLMETHTHTNISIQKKIRVHEQKIPLFKLN